MWSLDTFSFIYILYFILLVFSTIYRKAITHKGLFYVFIIMLSYFIFFCFFNLQNVLILNSYASFKFFITNVTWLNLDLSISLKLDSLSYFFALLVSIIGFGTSIYILNYFKYEANEDIFTVLLHWFIFSMLTLVLANNLFTLFLGWESIGIVSFFLINFWHTRRGTVKSSFKAFIFNKFSDIFLFIFIISLTYTTNTTDITLINMSFLLNIYNYNITFIIIICSLISCAIFKSAQLFAHLWLPDSMEAPVPASALIHSATLVSAGIYLLMRFSTLLYLTQTQHIIIFIGSITALYGGLVSAAQTDMKKLLAYSTISHCGFLFLSIGLEFYIATIIYLFLHGLFKALTFFCAGSFIRVYGSQDMRNMGTGHRVLPVDSLFLIICSLNLGGLPFSFGYLYKSILLISVLNTNINIFSFSLVYFALLTGIVYTYRLIFYSIFDISKEFVPTLIFELQIKKNKIVNFFSLTSIAQIISIFITFIFTIFIYLVFKNIFLSYNFVFSQTITPIEYDSSNFNYLSNLYCVYYELFYSNYFICFLILVILAWRYSYTYQYKYIFFINLFYVYIVSIFFICGVIFWQKLLHNKILILVFQRISQKY